MNEDNWDIENPTCPYCGGAGHYACGTIGLPQSDQRSYIKELEKRLEMAKECVQYYGLVDNSVYHPGDTETVFVRGRAPFEAAGKLARATLEKLNKPIGMDK